jgi:ribonuclease R
LKTVIAPLYGAYRVLARARKRRGTLDLEIPERQVILDAAGHIDEIKPRARYDSHRLIEEFMIAANVAAAETLESLNWPCMFRVHEPPDPLKVEALAAVLDDLGFHLDLGRKMKPAEFGRILDAARGDPNEALINELVLRAQSQAVYSPENRGHFGLALRRYCHFTSPIRRYADLLVHRALISALRLGDDGLRPEDGGRFSEMGEHISLAERRAQAAERDALDRYLTVFLAKRVGQTFAGRITGVTRFGLFVRLEIEGAEGLVPVRSLGAEHFIHDEVRHALIGQHSDTAWVLGDGLQVRLVTADTVTGGLVFEIVSEARTRPASVPRPSRHRTSRPPKRRRHAVARRTRTH